MRLFLVNLILATSALTGQCDQNIKNYHPPFFRVSLITQESDELIFFTGERYWEEHDTQQHSAENSFSVAGNFEPGTPESTAPNFNNVHQLLNEFHVADSNQIYEFQFPADSQPEEFVSDFDDTYPLLLALKFLADDFIEEIGPFFIQPGPDGALDFLWHYYNGDGAKFDLIARGYQDQLDAKIDPDLEDELINTLTTLALQKCMALHVDDGLPHIINIVRSDERKDVVEKKTH